MTAVKINFESLEFKNSSISSVSSIKNIFARMASTCSGAIEILPFSEGIVFTKKYGPLLKEKFCQLETDNLS